MAHEIRRTYKGNHPTKTYKYTYKHGEPIYCETQLLAIVSGNTVAISMNGTAVMTLHELHELVRDIEGQVPNE